MKKALIAAILCLLPASVLAQAVPVSTTTGTIYVRNFPRLFVVQPVQTTNMYSAVDVSTTWNNGAVTFTGIKLNVTDTASASASKLMDLQVGGVTKFNVTKAGAGTFASTVTGTAFNTTPTTAVLVSAAEPLTVSTATWGATLSAKPISVADTETRHLAGAASTVCMMFLANNTDNSNAMYQIRGTTNSTTLFSGDGAVYTVTKDTASRINLYYDAAGASGAGYYVQNLRGGTRSIRLACIGG